MHRKKRERGAEGSCPPTAKIIPPNGKKYSAAAKNILPFLPLFCRGKIFFSVRGEERGHSGSSKKIIPPFSLLPESKLLIESEKVSRSNRSVEHIELIAGHSRGGVNCNRGGYWLFAYKVACIGHRGEKIISIIIRYVLVN